MCDDIGFKVGAGFKKYDEDGKVKEKRRRAAAECTWRGGERERRL